MLAPGRTPERHESRPVVGRVGFSFRSRIALYAPVKLVSEWIVALALLMVLAPLLLLTAIATLSTTGSPVFHAQTRSGRCGRTFRLYRLRVMHHRLDDTASADGPRMTRLGRLLRAAHVEELPELWNVLLGDMGLIGPRAGRTGESEQVAPRRAVGIRRRMCVRPGVVGLAQLLVPPDELRSSSPPAVRRRLAYDLYYVGRMSPLLDLRIALCLPCYVLRSLTRAAAAALLQVPGDDSAAQTPCPVTGTTAPDAPVEARTWR